MKIRGLRAIVRSRQKLIDLLLSQIVPLTASALTTLATAVILGASGRGELALIVGGSGLVGAVLFLNLQVGIVRAVRDGDPTAVRRGWTIGGLIAMTVLVIGVGLSLVAPVASVGLFGRTVLSMISIGGALVLFNLIVLRTRQGLGDSRIFRDSWFLQSILYPVLGIPLALMTHSAVWVVICWYAALLVSTIYGASAGRKTERPVPSAVQISSRQIVTTSLAGHIGVVGQQLLLRADVVILGFFVSASALGTYSIAAPIAGLIWVFSEALSLLAFDRGGKGVSAVQRSVQRRRLTGINFLIGAAGTIIIALASIFLIPWLLPQYIPAIPLILILLPGVLAQGYARIALSSILTSGSKRAPIFIGVASAVLSILYVPFVVILGVIGAAVASTLIYILQTITVALVVRYFTKSQEAGEESTRV